MRVCLAKSKKISERSTRGLCLTQCRLHIDQLRALRPFYWIHKGIVPSTFLSLSSILLPLIYKATQNIDYRKAADIVRVWTSFFSLVCNLLNYYYYCSSSYYYCYYLHNLQPNNNDYKQKFPVFTKINYYNIWDIKDNIIDCFEFSIE